MHRPSALAAQQFMRSDLEVIRENRPGRGSSSAMLHLPFAPLLHYPSAAGRSVQGNPQSRYSPRAGTRRRPTTVFPSTLRPATVTATRCGTQPPLAALQRVAIPSTAHDVHCTPNTGPWPSSLCCSRPPSAGTLYHSHAPAVPRGFPKTVQMRVSAKLLIVAEEHPDLDACLDARFVTHCRSSGLGCLARPGQRAQWMSVSPVVLPS